MAMFHLQSKEHSDQVLLALQNRNRSEVSLIGNDRVSTNSDSLWLFSPLVRSIVGSIKDLDDNLMILPDFSYEDLQTGLDIIESNDRDILVLVM